MINKKILILGAGNAQIDLINYCNSIGMETYGCSYTNTDKGIPLLHHFEQINIVDADAITKYFVENQIDYIYSVGSDIAIPTVCEAAERTNKFQFISAETAKICCNKHLMRKAMEGSIYNLPYIVSSTFEDIDWRDLFPAMIKPVDSQGQRGVYLVENMEELWERFDKSVSYSRSGKVIIEKYISGDEVSVNAYMKDGKLIFCMISDRESFKEFPGGIIKEHHLPSVYENTPAAERIRDLVIDTTRRLEINNGPVYFQIKVAEEQPYLIEVTPRLDGCHMWKLIEQYCGINLLDLTMKHFMGEQIEIKGCEKSAYHMHLAFFCEPPETIFDENKYKRYVSDNKILYYQTGDKVRRLNGYMEKCGYRIYKSPYKIAVIGGCGFIGANFINLYQDGFQLANISRKNSTITEYSTAQLEIALKDCDSAVILAAKKVSSKEEQSLELYEDNIRIVKNSLEACKRLGIKNVVFTSTRCVYDPNQNMPVSEDGMLHPINQYGESKLAAEQICADYNEKYGMNIKILRLSQVFGEINGEYMAGRFIKNALSGETMAIYGNSMGRRDYIYVKDACYAILKALQSYDKRGVYNIGSGKAVSTREFAEAVIKGLASTSYYVIQKEKKEDPSVSYFNVSKARGELGFSCQFSLENALRDLKNLLDKGENKSESTI